MEVIQSGCENLDSHVGVYAPDGEAYAVFADLFDPIIEEYHFGFAKTANHPAANYGDAIQLTNLDPNSDFIVSTRVRVCRSLKGFGFNPTMKEEDYKAIETKLKDTLLAATGELHGIYYPLPTMDKKLQTRLVDWHYLFKEGDKYLQAANSCRFWPTGRGIFINLTKTFCVWFNEEDHMRIISLQEGGNLRTVYSRLLKGIRFLESKLEFAKSDRLGHLTLCPTNLGTTIRASVLICLPKLAANKAKLEEVAGKFKLQVRGPDGEHSESKDGLFDVSNQRRLGLTEWDAILEMQSGIQELINIEKTL